MEAARQKTVTRAPAPQPTPAVLHVVNLVAPAVQQKSNLRVSSPRDPAEREAESTAKRIMRMEAPSVARFASSVHLMREQGAPRIDRKAEGHPTVPSELAAKIQSTKPSGRPLPPSVRRFMEPRFGADFRNVRVHTGSGAGKLNRTLGAQAFTLDNHVFFGPDRFRPETHEGKELIAHELTHTIQQGAVVQRKADISVNERSGGEVQRWGLPSLNDLRNYFAREANLIPGFRMFTVVIGMNPINGAGVDRSAANILRAAVELFPGGGVFTRVLDQYGIFEKAGAMVEQQIASLGISGDSIVASVNAFIARRGLGDILNMGAVWEEAKQLIAGPAEAVKSFVVGLASAVLELIKDAILRPLANLASQTAGWDLLCAVLGKNPITGDTVPPTAENLIGGFMKLIGRSDIWENIQKGNAVGRAIAWFKNAANGAKAFVQEIPGLFVQAVKALRIDDIADLPGAFAKVAKVFGNFIGRFTDWAGGTIWDLLEIIISVVAPGVLGYIKKAAAAFRTILENPMGFVMNLIAAGKLGFTQFAGNFVSHLKKSLIGWLTGSLGDAGVYIPQALSLVELGKFVLSVMGVSWAKIRAKIVKALGPSGETIMKAMETGFELVQKLVSQGPGAAWEMVKEKLADLRDTVMSSIMSFVAERVVQAAVTKLISMTNPAGAFIQAVLGIYNTIMFFVERLQQIAQVLAAIIDSISAIANGQISAAANFVERTMGSLLTLVISFLARLAGLGKVSDAIVKVVKKLQAKVDAALDKGIAWIVGKAKGFVEKIKGAVKGAATKVAQAGAPKDPKERLRVAAQAAISVAKRLKGRATRGLLAPALAAIRIRYGLTDLQPFEKAGTWWVTAKINPETTTNTGVPTTLVGPDGKTPAGQHQSVGGGARTPEGPNYEPLIGKLTQAVKMFTVWAGRGTSPVAQQMLRALEKAREHAQSLNEDQKRGMPQSALQPRMQAFAAELQTIQTMDPKYELVSIGAMSVTVMDARRQMPRTPLPPWTMLDPALRKEYEDQLRDQEAGLNAMTADQWQKNRAKFVIHKRPAAEKTMRGRFQRRSGNVPKTAAPHNPDQSLAGFIDPTGLPVNTDVNSHVGSQNSGKIPAIEAAIDLISPLTRVVTQLNFALTVA